LRNREAEGCFKTQKKSHVILVELPVVLDPPKSLSTPLSLGCMKEVVNLLVKPRKRKREREERGNSHN
jgi:hypothetical protein